MKKCSKLTHLGANLRSFAFQVRLIHLNPAWPEAAGDWGGGGGVECATGMVF